MADGAVFPLLSLRLCGFYFKGFLLLFLAILMEIGK